MWLAGNHLMPVLHKEEHVRKMIEHSANGRSVGQTVEEFFLESRRSHGRMMTVFGKNALSD